MLDFKGFVAGGWVHDLGLHYFQTDSQKIYLVPAKQDIFHLFKSLVIIS